MLFIASFLVVLYILELNFKSEQPTNFSKYNPIQDYSKLPSNEINLNGKNIKVYSGVSELPAIELIEKMKNEISSKQNFKLIHENTTDNRYYLTYSEDEIVISAVITAHADGSCNYQVYKALEPLTDNLIAPQKSFPFMKDAIPVLSLKGKGDQEIYSYTTRYSEKEIFSFYRQELLKIGYREEKVDLPEKLKINEIESNELYFVKDRKNLVISVSIDPAGNGTIVYIVGS